MANALLTRKALAVAFRTHPQTVVKWEAVGGMPVAGRGGPGRPSLYALPDVVAWYIARELAARGVDVAALDPKTERALLDRRRREEIEQKLAKLSGELIPRTEFARVLGPIVHRIKVALLATPRLGARPGQGRRGRTRRRRANTRRTHPDRAPRAGGAAHSGEHLMTDLSPVLAQFRPPPTTAQGRAAAVTRAHVRLVRARISLTAIRSRLAMVRAMVARARQALAIARADQRLLTAPTRRPRASRRTT